MNENATKRVQNTKEKSDDDVLNSKQQLIGRSSYDNISSLSVVEHRRGGRGVVPMYAAASSHRRGKHRNCGNRHNNYVEFIVVVEVFVSIAILCSLI
uniref:Transmembrane protein n=1 Tax=Cucumis melo TaxID=3656 RepID=A0A9I9EI27_CUCME